MGDPASAIAFEESPEGYAMRFDGEGNVVGVTVVNTPVLPESSEPIVVTVPERMTIDPASFLVSCNQSPDVDPSRGCRAHRIIRLGPQASAHPR